MNSREWDIYTITSACGNWSISARAVCVHSVCHLSLVFADLQRNKTVSVTEKKHGFKLEKDFESDSFTVFSGENLLLSFISKDSKVHLVLNAPDLVLPDGRKGVTVNVVLKGGRISGFEKKGRKSVYSGFMQYGMAVQGDIRLGNDYVDAETRDLFASLDWGRGQMAIGEERCCVISKTAASDRKVADFVPVTGTEYQVFGKIAGEPAYMEKVWQKQFSPK